MNTLIIKITKKKMKKKVFITSKKIVYTFLKINLLVYHTKLLNLIFQVVKDNRTNYPGHSKEVLTKGLK